MSVVKIDIDDFRTLRLNSMDEWITDGGAHSDLSEVRWIEGKMKILFSYAQRR